MHTIPFSIKERHGKTYSFQRLDKVYLPLANINITVVQRIKNSFHAFQTNNVYPFGLPLFIEGATKFERYSRN